jgi:hypothetical protein
MIGTTVIMGTLNIATRRRRVDSRTSIVIAKVKSGAVTTWRTATAIGDITRRATARGFLSASRFNVASGAKLRVRAARGAGHTSQRQQTPYGRSAVPLFGRTFW